jgi:hypothetical protein
MKKIISLIILLVLLLSGVALIASCNLLNNGSERELAGIYGVSDYFYRDVEQVTHNYADKYDYYILVLNEDKTAQIIIKPVGGEETIINTTYTVTFATDEPKRVQYVAIKNFPLSNYGSYLHSNVSEPLTTDATSFSLYPKREDLAYSTSEWRSNSEKKLVFVKLKYVFHRMYNTVTDNKIERAKKKQTENIDKRADTDSSQDDSSSTQN